MEKMKLNIIDLTDQGEGLAKTEQGQVVFVPNAVPGDVVECELVPFRKNIWNTENVEILELSSDRQDVPCKYLTDENFNCGGCQVQSLDYDKLNSIKEQNLFSQLERIAGLDLSQMELQPIIGMNEPWYFRNNVQLKVRYNEKAKNFERGFFANKSHEIVVHDKCLISQETDQIVWNVIEQRLRDIQPELRKTLAKNWDELIIRTGENTGEILVSFSFRYLEKTLLKAKFKNIWQEIFDEINARLAETDSVKHVLKSFWFLDLENNRNDQHVLGEQFFTEIILGKSFQIYPRSFFQVNTKQTEALFQTVRDFTIQALENNLDKNANDLNKFPEESDDESTKNTKETGTLYDLYCGTGTIGLILADLFKQVKGVESFYDAVQNAKQSAKINSVTNAEYFRGRAERWLSQQQTQTNDFIVVDPPRKGLEKTLIATLNQCEASHLIYVSCHPGTLSRDLKLLKEKWQVTAVRPVDMFPWTMNLETVALLSKLDAKEKIEIKLEMDERSEV